MCFMCPLNELCAAVGVHVCVLQSTGWDASVRRRSWAQMLTATWHVEHTAQTPRWGLCLRHKRPSNLSASNYQGPVKTKLSSIGMAWETNQVLTSVFRTSSRNVFPYKERITWLLCVIALLFRGKLGLFKSPFPFEIKSTVVFIS